MVFTSYLLRLYPELRTTQQNGFPHSPRSNVTAPNMRGGARCGVYTRIQRPPSITPAELHTNMTSQPHVPSDINLKYRAKLLEDLPFSSITIDETFLSGP